jgi:transposase
VNEHRLNSTSASAPSVWEAPINPAPAKVIPPDPEVCATNSRRRFTFAYKQRIVREADACRENGQIGALLRQEGLYSSHLTIWRKQLLAPPKRQGRKPIDTVLAAQLEENRKLLLEKTRLQRRLAQAEAIIDIQKKVSALLGIRLNPIESDEIG